MIIQKQNVIGGINARFRTRNTRRVGRVCLHVRIIVLFTERTLKPSVTRHFEWKNYAWMILYTPSILFSSSWTRPQFNNDIDLKNDFLFLRGSRHGFFVYSLQYQIVLPFPHMWWDFKDRKKMYKKNLTYFFDWLSLNYIRFIIY